MEGWECERVRGQFTEKVVGGNGAEAGSSWRPGPWPLQACLVSLRDHGQA